MGYALGITVAFWILYAFAAPAYETHALVIAIVLSLMFGVAWSGKYWSR